MIPNDARGGPASQGGRNDAPNALLDEAAGKTARCAHASDASERRLADAEMCLIRQAALIARLARDGSDTAGAQAEYAILLETVRRLHGEVFG